MEFTHEQISEIISEITNGEQGLQGLVKYGLEGSYTPNNVGLFFLSIPISGFIPSDRFAWNGPIKLSLISSVLLLLGKTKSFVFLSLIRRTH